MYLEELYLFTGTEQVIKKNKIDRILENVDTEETDIIKYDLELTPIQDVITDCITIPFLKKNKIIICKNPILLTNAKTPIKHDIKLLIKYLKNPSEQTTLIIDAVGVNIDTNSELYKTFQKCAYIIDVKSLDQIETRAWVRRNVELAGSSIQDEALNLLVEYLGDDLLRAEKEIEKLAQFRYGSRICENDIKELVVKNYENDSFELVKAIIAKNNRRVIEIYENLKKHVNNTQYILAMISKSILDLYTVKKLMEESFDQKDIADVLNVKAGKAYYLMKDAKEFRIEQLEAYLSEIEKIDFQIKQGLIDKDFGIDMLLLKL